MKIKLYLDEDVQVTIAKTLREKGYDVIATEEVGRQSSPDDDQLEYAIRRKKRAVFSYNRGHFAQRHYKYLSDQLEHYGIIISDQYPIGTAVNCLIRLFETLTADDMINRLEYLSNWR